MKAALILICSLIFLLRVNVSFSTSVTYCRCASHGDAFGVGSVFKLNSKIVAICAGDVQSESVSPDRQIFENDTSDTDSLSLRGCSDSTLDPRIPTVFKNLEYYEFSNNGIESLSPDDLRFSNLKNLQGDSNKLTSIPAGLFIHAPRLHTINLGDNNITALEAGTFSELSDLGWVNMEGNPIRHYDGKILLPIHFRIGTFRISYETVEVLDISHMGDIFNFTVTARFFEFGQYEKIADDRWGYYVWSHRNEIFEHLKVLNASGSPVAGIGHAIELLGPSIEVLDVSSSPVGHFNGSAFDRFVKLHYLNLSNTKLTDFDFGDIHNRAELNVLDISYNDLQKINFTPEFGSFEKLETLNLIGNQLTEIDFVTPANFPKLTALGISQNQFGCDYLKEFLGQWPDLQLFESDSAKQVLNVRGIDCRDK